MRAWLLFQFALLGVAPAYATAQARIEAIIPEDAEINVHPLGSDGTVPATVGLELMPGDLIGTAADSVFLELRCGAEDRASSYLLTSPFRVLIDVPIAASCHVNLLSGLTEVVAETPTETTAGGVTLGSTGTQYAVEVRRSGDALVFNCIVHDDTVRVLTRPGLQAVAGTKLVWSAGTVQLARNSNEDLTRSAATYARFDLAAASRQGVQVEDTAATVRQLTALHYAVLSSPSDTASRADLAREQLRYGVNRGAVYNLNRVDLRTEADLRRYRIEGAAVRGAQTDVSRARGAEVRVSPEMRRAAAGGVAAAATTEGDLRLIEAGRIDEAIANLQTRVRAGAATSRDYYALARAHAAGNALAELRSSAGRALVLHASDGLLSAADLRELGELIARRD